MPTYDFSCDCGWRGEMIVVSYSDAPPRCPDCGSVTRRLFSPTRSLFVAEPFREENIEPIRAVRDRTERDPSFAARRRRVQEIAQRVNERAVD